MRRIILLGGMLLVAAGVTILVFEMPKPVAAQHFDLVGVAEPNDSAPLSKPRQNSPAPLIKPWQDLRDEMALP
ncbi:MAG: hypothetical protein WCD69_06595 [Xanthobacteraceae bacterium]